MRPRTLRIGRLAAAIFPLALLVPAIVVSAADMDTEIQQLMRRVESSTCSFVRNGTAHTPADAREHMERKYEFVKSYVHTTEDFIEKAASKSSMTGDPYYVDCPDQKRVTTEAWLTDQLQQIRKTEEH
jgi:hypothetical protein